jgi:hypothetical protein
VSQPVIALLDGNRELLVAENATWFDALLLIVLIGVVPPLLATGYAWLASRLSPWIGDIVYLFLLGLFCVPFAVGLAKRAEPSALATIAFAGVAAAGAVFLYARVRAVRMLATVMVALPVVGLLLFARALPELDGEAHAAVVASGAPVRAPHPVVFVVFDEFPVRSLLTREGSIDDVRYPHFARLARDGTWYPNATTVHDSTKVALPSILTGRKAHQDYLPIAANYPDNLFTALMGARYELDVHEATTRLCPPVECTEYDQPISARLKGLLNRVRPVYLARVLPRSVQPSFRDVDFERVQGGKMNEALVGFNGLLAGIERNEPRSTIHFAHVLVPHSPWRFFPSGKTYNFDGRDGLVDRDHWIDQRWPTLQAQQQHLLQVGFTDRLLGKLLERLDDTGMYDDALVIVLADHGISFRPGASHRWASPENLWDIANVPLFVKYPNQRRGSVDRRPARIVDVVPTVAEVLGLSLPFRVDGTSLRGPVPGRSMIELSNRDGIEFRASLRSMFARRQALLAQQARDFGQGSQSMFSIGDARELLGTSVTAEGPAPREGLRVEIESRAAFDVVNTRSGFVPAEISGIVRGERLDPTTEVAVAVNGRIRALTKPVDWEGKQVLGALVAENSFRDGSNRVDMYLIQGEGSGRRLILLGSTAAN